MSSEKASEVPLRGGWMTEGVVRVGETVRRPAGKNSAFVVRLLQHLEEVGFACCPRFLGYDERGRETLTFIAGEVPSDCRSVVWRDDQLAASMALLRSFHDHTAGSELAGRAEVVCHNDYGPWNLVWRGGLPAAVVDFDTAAPGKRLDDVGYAMWKHLNLGLVDLPVSEQRRRVGLATDGYGVAADAELLAAIQGAQATMRRLIESGPPGRRRDDALAQLGTEEEWLALHGSELVA